MNALQNIFLHVGYPKCASTFFQKKVFSVHPDLSYIGPENKAFRHLFLMQRESLYDPDAVKGLFEPHKKIGVISMELLVGDPFFSDFDGDFYARRLYETFPSADIIIIIRNQLEAIESLFMQWIKTGWGGKFGPNDFFKTSKLNDENIGFNFRYFEYSKTIRYYQRLFGEDRVHVFLFEEFTKDLDGVIGAMCGRMGVRPPIEQDRSPMRVKMTPMGYMLMRLLNRYRQGKFNPYGGPADFIPWLYILKARNTLDNAFKKILPSYKRSWLCKKKKQLIENYYRQDNQYLSNLIGIDLRQYHYPM